MCARARQAPGKASQSAAPTADAGLYSAINLHQPVANMFSFCFSCPRDRACALVWRDERDMKIQVQGSCVPRAFARTVYQGFIPFLLPACLSTSPASGTQSNPHSHSRSNMSLPSRHIQNDNFTRPVWSGTGWSWAPHWQGPGHGQHAPLAKAWSAVRFPDTTSRFLPISPTSVPDSHAMSARSSSTLSNMTLQRVWLGWGRKRGSLQRLIEHQHNGSIKDARNPPAQCRVMWNLLIQSDACKLLSGFLCCCLFPGGQCVLMLAWAKTIQMGYFSIWRAYTLANLLPHHRRLILDAATVTVEASKHSLATVHARPSSRPSRAPFLGSDSHVGAGPRDQGQVADDHGGLDGQKKVSG